MRRTPGFCRSLLAGDFMVHRLITSRIARKQAPTSRQMGIPRGSGIRGKIGLSALRSKNASISVVSGNLAPTKTSSGRPFFAFMFFQIPDSTIARPNRLLIRGLILLLAFIGFAGAVMVAAPARSQQLTSPDQVPEGLAKSDWSSIRAADEAGPHVFQPTANGRQARNHGQQWTTLGDPPSGNLCRANRKCSR